MEFSFVTMDISHAEPLSVRTEFALDLLLQKKSMGAASTDTMFATLALCNVLAVIK